MNPTQKLIEAAEAAIEALTNCASEHGHRCNRCDSEVDEGGRVADALRKIAGDEKPHRKLPILPPDDAQADRVRRIEENGPYPGMSLAFERHVGVECAWTDPEHAQEASMWAAAWKAAVRHAADEPVRDVFGNRWPA